jgi:hypothetical protein
LVSKPLSYDYIAKYLQVLDNEERKEEEEYNRLQVEFDANGQRHAENGRREIWARVAEEVARDSELYIL